MTAARDDLAVAVRDLQDRTKQAKGQATPTPEVQERLERDFGSRARAARERLQDEVRRVGELPGGVAFLRELEGE